MAAPAGPVLMVIPEEASLFVAVKNITDLTGKIDTLVTDIGLSPGGAMSSLNMLMSKENFGPGFNANGGFGLAVIDPNLLGYKIEDLMGESAAEKPAPLIYLVPCTDLKTLWPGATISEANGLTKLDVNGETVYAKMMGSYAVLGDGPEPVRLAAATKHSAMAKVSKAHQAIITQADAAVYADVKSLQPWIKALAQKASEEMDNGPGMPWGRMSNAKAMKFWSRMTEDMDALSIGINVNKSGLIFNRYVTFVPQSKMAAMLGGVHMASATTSMLTQMPNLPYVLAAGSADMAQFSPQAQAATRDWLAQLLTGLAPGVSADTKTKLTQLAVDVYSQVKSVRVFIGGAPKDSGVFAVGIVLNSDNPDAILAKMPEIVPLKQQVLNAIIASAKSNAGMHMGMSATGSAPASEPAMPAEQKVTLKYTPAALNVAGAAVATIDVDSPTLVNMEPDQKAQMAKVLGEGQIRFYIAKASDKSLVITFGGSQAFLAEAIKAAKAGRDLAADPMVAAGIKEMPAGLSSLGLFNVPNLVMQVKAGVAAVAGPQVVQNSPFASIELKPGTPVTIGRSLVDNGDQARVFIPEEMMSDIAHAYMTFVMSMMGGGPGPGGPNGSRPGQHDF
jgi:hypothetical protein